MGYQTPATDLIPLFLLRSFLFNHFLNNLRHLIPQMGKKGYAPSYLHLKKLLPSHVFVFSLSMASKTRYILASCIVDSFS